MNSKIIRQAHVYAYMIIMNFEWILITLFYQKKKKKTLHVIIGIFFILLLFFYDRNFKLMTSRFDHGWPEGQTCGLTLISPVC